MQKKKQNSAKGNYNKYYSPLYFDSIIHIKSKKFNLWLNILIIIDISENRIFIFIDDAHGTHDLSSPIRA